MRLDFSVYATEHRNSAVEAEWWLGELEREIERLKEHPKEELMAQRAWDWHLHEMREAATMDHSMLDETLGDPSPAPKVSDFTPINHHGYSDTAPIDSEYDHATIKSTAADKPRAQKRRKIQPSAATTASKPKKAARSKKTKRAKTAAQLDCQDISQSLLRTKPTSSGDGALRAKIRPSFGGIPLEQNLEPHRIGNTPIDFEVEPAPFGLADKCQAAYTNVRGDVVNQATPPTPPKSDEVEAELNYNDQSRDRKSATKHQASPDIDVERPIEENPESDGSIITTDFGAPPSTQTSPPTLQERDFLGMITVDKFEPLDLISDELFELGDMECGDHGGEDEFSIDDDCLEEMMQSMAVPVEEEPVGSHWRPLEFSDDALCIDKQPENDQSHWPGAITGSDGVVMYDEGPTIVMNNIMNGPSSPSWSSQASCILTHATGNAEPDRARTSEGSENCFEDHDLDDSLIDLMINESKGLQVTSPATPAKRPSSPKLKWLSPKTYTPAKSTQILIFPRDDPHIVPVNFNDDALPFIRPPFPKAVRDRSPILGLSNRTVLRICFRIGEALNAAAVASRTNVDAIIELYARVLHSSREVSGGYKQFFQFGDLFTNKPPYLSGTYALWKGVGLWDNDSRELVGDQGRGKMTRVLGRMKRKDPVQGQGPGVEMVVLSIWEVDWEEIGAAKGIVCD